MAATHALAKAQAADVESDRLAELVQMLRARLVTAEQRCDEIGTGVCSPACSLADGAVGRAAAALQAERLKAAELDRKLAAALGKRPPAPASAAQRRDDSVRAGGGGLAVVVLMARDRGRRCRSGCGCKRASWRGCGHSTTRTSRSRTVRASEEGGGMLEMGRWLSDGTQRRFDYAATCSIKTNRFSIARYRNSSARSANGCDRYLFHYCFVFSEMTDIVDAVRRRERAVTGELATPSAVG
jgi:hypothetical protein